jgi:7-cyano-7-deazaguanine synthase in queuosine biosynthesis
MYTASVISNDCYPQDGNLYLRPGINLITGEEGFQSKVDENPTSLEIDLLTLASAIYACDLAFKRGERENISRKISLTIPVTNYAIFNNSQNVDDLIYALYILSHDAWQINFVPKTGIPEPTKSWTKVREGNVLLFSGGLDSFAGAIQYLESGNELSLASHVTSNSVVIRTQNTLRDYLKTKFPQMSMHFPIRVSSIDKSEQGFPFTPEDKREETQRTRSFLFLTLATLIARRKGLEKVVYIAENGQMAIHLPLTAARMGAFSTHTAHPEFIHIMGDLFSRILNFQIDIENPFLYKTKAEVVQPIITKHADMIGNTVSCWKASRVFGDKNHCGICIPCLIRRIAIESNGIHLLEYKRDLLNENVGELPPTDDGKRNLMELLEFIKLFERESQASLEAKYPELINNYFDAEKAVRMYRKFASEAHDVMNQYPTIRELLG